METSSDITIDLKSTSLFKATLLHINKFLLRTTNFIHNNLSWQIMLRNKAITQFHLEK